jgi:serine protease Do
VKGRVFSSNPAIDLALVKVDGYAKLPPPVEFADSGKLQAGQWAIAIGEPFSLQRSVSVGVVSGFNRDEPIGGRDDVRLFHGLLQTSAPINPGNSGGPLVDYNGRVIGMNQSTANPGAAQGIGFAIPSNMVAQTAGQLAKAQGQTVNANGTGTGVAYLGVYMADLDNNVRTQIGYNGQGGVAVANVPDNTPAARAGLTGGDVILKIDGRPVAKSEDVSSYLKTLKPGATVRLNVWSQGKTSLVAVKLEEQPVNTYLQQQQRQQQTSP